MALGQAQASRLHKFVIQTSDVIQDLRVNVLDETGTKIIWYKERYLGEDEIVENLVFHGTNIICWTIHRPIRGWYIRLRSPLFPPGVFIPLIPVPQNAPYHVDAALSFNCRTNIPDLPPPTPVRVLQEAEASSSSAGIHSYPPTPISASASSSSTMVDVPPTQPSGAASPRSSSSSTTPLTSAPTGQSSMQPLPPPPHRPQQSTQFLLAPISALQPQSSQTTAPSFFSRALSVLKSHAPTYSNSFTLSRVLPPNPTLPPPPYRPNTGSASATPTTPTNAPSSPIPTPNTPKRHSLELPTHHTHGVPPPGSPGTVETFQSAPAVTEPNLHSPLHAPLLTFHDRTSVFTVRSNTGLLEIDQAQEEILGVDTAFWVAVALTYLEFLEERESYLAAMHD